MSRIVRFHEHGGPEVLKIEELATPSPGPGEVTLQVKAIGLNRAESMFRTGLYIESPQFPARLGYEAAGVVAALGSDVNGLSIGDAVSLVPPPSITRWGTYGEVANVPAQYLVKHPASLSWPQAAAIWMQYVTAWGALVDLAQLAPNDTVIVTAASSSVGIAAIQMAKMIGATVIATTRTRAKRDALRAAGAHHVVATQEEDLVERVREITNGAGARVAFDAVAGPQFEHIAQALSADSVALVYGALSPEPTPMPLFPMLGKRISVHGYTYKRVIGDSDRFARAKRFIVDALRSGELEPVIDKIFTFDHIVDAHRYLESNQQFGKIVVTL
ncbi:MAG: zinc-dependent alcohol dehydrogenase family protein [Burkholderiales bacterium]|nr:zinc-dependent alcohol dehydrogenase family protein [Burkholderiales bacterium]